MALPRLLLVPITQAVVALGFAAAFCPSNVWAQPITATDSQVELLRAELKKAESTHAGDARIGHLWRDLGIAYESRLAEGPAEDAYVRAIPLLRSAGRDFEYADALHGLGSVYLNMEQRPEAR